MGLLADRYGRQLELGHGRTPSAHGIGKWVSGQLEWIQNQLEEGVGPELDVPEGWFKATLTLHRSKELHSDYFKPHLAALRHELHAQGWNAIEFEHDPTGANVILWELLVPVEVVPDSGEPFPIDLDPEEDVTSAVSRIVQKGAWRYLPGGTREFIPSHRIVLVRQGSEPAPGGE